MMTKQEYEALQRRADRICSLILMSDVSDADIVVERSLLYSEMAREHPEEIELYDLIYESRFDRLWEQFRGS